MAMGDIAFNLLIFFVILARVNDDSHVKWTPALADELEAPKTPKASVAIDIDGKVYLNGRPISSMQLATGLENLLGSAPAGERTVLLKVHESTVATTFEPILEAVGQAGGDAVHVLNPKGKGGG